MFGERWRQIVAEKAAAAAITAPDSVVSFAELDALADQVVVPQDGPVFAQGTATRIAAAMIAAWRVGAVVQVLEADRPARQPVVRPPQQTALIKQTVGASGLRRCQFFSLPQVMADVDRLHGVLHLAEHSAIVAPISMGHSYGLSIGVLQVLRHGVPLVWVPHPFPGPVAAALHGRSGVLLAAVPSLWKTWCLGGVNLAAVRTGLSAGATLTVALEKRVREASGLKLRTLYGTSECGAVALDLREDLRESDAEVGALLPGVKVQVQGGRLLVESDAVGLQYDQLQAGEVFGAGQHLTWDEGQMRDEKLYLDGFCGSGINVAGRKLSPVEVAAKIHQSTGLQVQVSGFKSRDPERCEEICAAVSLPVERLTTEFKAKACELLAPWEVPRRWRALS
jgi:long-chain acyl-CoA synthetase